MKKHILNNEWSIADIITSNKGTFPFRQYLVIPNVYWGFNLNYECDLIVMSKNKILYDIEIKSSLQDLKNDFKKYKNVYYSGKNHKKISFKYYAMPKEMINEKSLAIIPEDCGIIEVDLDKKKSKIIKKAKKISNTEKLSNDDYMKLLRLCAMRYWSSRHKTFQKLEIL